MTNDYLKMLLAKEKEVRNRTKQLMNRSKENDDVANMSDSEFEENELLCRIIIGIANKQDIILEKLEKLENRA